MWGEGEFNHQAGFSHRQRGSLVLKVEQRGFSVGRLRGVVLGRPFGRWEALRGLVNNGKGGTKIRDARVVLGGKN